MYGYAGLVASVIFYEQNAKPHFYWFVVLSLIWPHIAYLISKNGRRPRALEYRNFLVDSLITGSWVTLSSFNPWFSTAIIIGQNSLCLMTGGGWLYVKGFCASACGVLLMGAVMGFEVNWESSFTVMSMSSVLVLMYINTSAIVSYRQNIELKNTHLKLKEKKEQIEEIAKKIAKYVSPQIHKSIFSGEKEVRIETSKKRLTVFFSDIVGFTAITESTPIDDLTEWLNGYLNDMTNIALRYNGTVDKFIGDAVMVFFGDPESSGEKEDARKCLQMAMEMREHARRLGIGVRIGINTGDCIVGNFGSEEHMEYTIIGGAVNLAARLETSADPGKILISDTTYELVQDVVECTPRELVHMKGFGRDIMSYWADDYKGSDTGVRESQSGA